MKLALPCCISHVDSLRDKDNNNNNDDNNNDDDDDDDDDDNEDDDATVRRCFCQCSVTSDFGPNYPQGIKQPHQSINEA